MTDIHRAFLALGSNLGNPGDNLEQAIHRIGKLIGTVVCRSAFYDTEPWGFSSANRFSNAVLCVDTPLSPRALLEATQGIERAMGRDSKSADGIYHDRIIDIDILLYDDICIDEPDLKIPHPLMEQRDFVMVPLNDVLRQMRATS